MENIASMLDIVLRSMLSVIFLFVITRLMGRKQISQLSFFDYIIGISIGSIAAAMAVTTDISYIDGFLGMIVYSIFAITISILTNKSMKFRRFINGRVYVLIKEGKILDKNLSKVKYDINDLLAEARFAGYFNIADIEYALMESSGRISFMPKAAKTTVVQEDLQLQNEQEHLIANVIIDGKIMIQNLKMTGLDIAWLTTELSKQHFKSNDVILATVDWNNRLTVYEKAKNLVQKTYID